MPLTAGTRLGPYEIVAPIGSGGMGHVYRARDTRLDRTVAIKVVKEQFTERFEREYRAISALNHPRICTLHDIGSHEGVGYLVMEFVDGKPLKGPLPLTDALRTAIQIADALEAAHAKGIVHRDLKPGNILTTNSGIKLLDFGLAAFARSGIRATDVTMTTPLTMEGQIVGTLQYMSPEQLEGKEADARSDIFSFGVVLYELLTGRRAFEGSSPASLIAAILKEEPPPLTPMQVGSNALDHTLRKCLAKDPARRWQTATDLRDELVWIAETTPVAQPESVSRRALLPWIGGATAGAASAGIAAWALRGKSVSAPARAVRFRLPAPEGVWPERVITRQSLALSPVGGRIATIASDERGPMIWVQRLDSLKATALPGTEGAQMVFWSPDGQFIGFFAGGQIKKISAEGGTPLPICDLPQPWSATWNKDEEIVASSPALSSWLISVRSGAIRTFPWVFWPRFLPDGKHLICVKLDPKIEPFRASVEELSTHRSKDLFRTDTEVIFAPDRAGTSIGHLIFGRGSTLLTQRFDTGRLTMIGDPEPLAEGVPFFRPTAWSEFDVSADGVLIFSAASPKAQLTWVDRSGHPVGTIGGLQNFFGGLRISPDGRKIAVDVADLANGGTDIWVYDLVKSLSERVTFEPGVEASPVWSPDGKRLVFASAQSGSPQLRMKFLSDHGIGDAFAPSEFQLPLDWSPDGRWIFFQTTGGEMNASIWLASVSDRKIMPLVQSSFDSSAPALSPDGRFLAFSANETGRSEIYVQRFESGDTPKMTGERRRVSQDGGNMPRWRRDGKELFFVAPDRRIFAVSANGSKDLEFGTPSPLFRLPAASRIGATSAFSYDFSPDGQKFLLANRDAASSPLHVLVNWQATLKT